MRRLALIAALALAPACGDNLRPQQEAPYTPDAAPASPLTPCLDRPTDLDRPPTGQLPCDLLPPGFEP